MKKDITILKLLERLRLGMDLTRVEIVDYWEADLCAIGLKKGGRMVYISTFNYANCEEFKCDFDLEIIDENNEERISVFKAGRRVSQSDLENEMKLFLDL